MEKIGPKDKHVNIPDGWYKVTTGPCQQGDMFADVFSGKLLPVENEDLGMPAETFDLLIREAAKN